MGSSTSSTHPNAQHLRWPSQRPQELSQPFLQGLTVQQAGGLRTSGRRSRPGLQGMHKVL